VKIRGLIIFLFYQLFQIFKILYFNFPGFGHNRNMDETILPLQDGPKTVKIDDPDKHEIQRWNNLFNLKSANEWMVDDEVQDSVQQTLFGNFWLESELSILFSDTARGKSILAVQIAESLARGIPLAPFDDVPPAQKVVYFDFEMTQKQFTARYSAHSPETGEREDYQFSENLFRAQMALHDELPCDYKNITEFLYHSFRELLRESRARVVIVDNITFLKGANQNVAAAAQLMKGLKYVKDYHRISILVLAHASKRSATAPLSINDMQGSNMLTNFADNVFAIGASCRDVDLRYLKQIKPRGTILKYDKSNVVAFRIAKRHNFLQFEFEGCGPEREHLIPPPTIDNADKSAGEKAGPALMRVAITSELKKMRDAGLNVREMAEVFAIAPSTVSRYLNSDAKVRKVRAAILADLNGSEPGTQ
jgi:hypothetical protein